MKLTFLKEFIRIGRRCKECGVEYTGRSQWSVRLGLCAVHRREWFKKFYQEYTKEYLRTHPEARLRAYQSWRRWVIKNLSRRRTLALESYHRNKNKPGNKKRRHIKKSAIDFII